jgi:hypothetical protein
VLKGGPDEAGVALARSSGLREVSSLELLISEMGPEGFRALVGSSALTRLCRLVINSFGLDLRVRALEDGPMAGQIQHLQLISFGGCGADALRKSPRLLSGLVTLGILYDATTDETIQGLASSPHLSGLRNLVLKGYRLSDAGLTALAHSPLMSHLRFLSLGKNLATAPKGLLAIARAAAALPACQVELSRRLLSSAEAAEITEALGPRLTLVR